uniref:Uncharacterized protein n=1 Tax=Moniliophthora roreri TaxID=221103 RepID=A0A0W0G2T3_MONRR
MNNGLSAPKKDTKPASKADAKSNQELSPPKKGHRKSPSDPGNTGGSSEERNKLGKGMLSKTPTIKEPRKEDPTGNLGRKSPTPSNRSERITHDESRKPQGPAPGLLKPPVSAEERRARTRSLELPAGRQQAKKAEDLSPPKEGHRRAPSDPNPPKMQSSEQTKDATTKKTPTDREPAKEPARTRKTSLPDSKSQHLAPNVPRKPRVSNPDSLKPPISAEKRQTRPRSMEVPTAVQQAKSNKEVAKEPKSTPYTDLNQEVKLPWGETFRLGYGIDALTGDPTTRCALAPFRMRDSRRRIKSTNTTINVLHWDDLKQLADGIELEAGVGTVNAASFQLPVEMRAKLSSMLSTSTSAKTLLVQYKTVGEFEVEFLPRDIALKPELKRLSAKDFREQYGDYYIAGCQYGYSCRAIIVCRMNQQVDSSSFEAEAKAHVENILRAGVKSTDAKDHSNKCTMLHVVIDTKGCSAAMSSISDGNIQSVAATLRSLAQVTKNAQGTPLTAYLHHYSTLDNSILPRRLEGLNYNLFTKAQRMRLYYAQLQAFLLHPALRMFVSDRNKIDKALKAFEHSRRKLIYLSPADKKRVSECESVYKDLQDLNERSSLLNARYEFIRGVKNMDTNIKYLPPTGTSKLFRWVCGKTGGRMQENVCGFQCVSFGPRYKAYEAEWTSPMTSVSKGQILLIKLGGSGGKQFMEFNTVPLSALSLKSLPGSAKTRPAGVFAVPVPGDKREKEKERFSYQLVGDPVYVLGWSLSCEWDGKYVEDEPEIKVQGENNCILSDHVSIGLDTSRAAQWTCRVTFVFQRSFNFPDLSLQPGPAEEQIKKAHNLLLAGTAEQ